MTHSIENSLNQLRLFGMSAEYAKQSTNRKMQEESFDSRMTLLIEAETMICPHFNGQLSGRLNVSQFEVYRR